MTPLLKQQDPSLMNRDAPGLYLQINIAAKESSLDLAKEKEAAAIVEFLTRAMSLW